MAWTLFLATSTAARADAPARVRDTPSLADIRLTGAEIAEAEELIQGWGVRLPDDHPFLLAAPFAEPLNERSMIVPPAWLLRSSGYNPWDGVDAKLFKKDVEYFHILMKYRYGGYHRAEQFGWNWDTFFSDWLRLLDAAGDRRISFDEATAPLNKFKEFQIDNHTHFLTRIPPGGPTPEEFDTFLLNFAQPSQTYVLAESPGGSCESATLASGSSIELVTIDQGQQPRAVKIVTAFSSLFETRYYLSQPIQRDLVSVTCGGKVIPLTKVFSPSYPARLENIGTLATQDSERAIIRHLSDGIAYLRLPTFSDDMSPTCTSSQQILIPDGFGKEKILVIDLRNNHGGDFVGCAKKALSPWITLSEEMVRRTFSKTTRRSCLVRSTTYGPVDTMGWIPAAERIVNNGLTDDLRQEIQSATDDIFASPAGAACQWKDEVTTSPLNMSQHTGREFFEASPDQLRLILLVDNYCGSDCEAAVQSLTMTFPTLIVGTNTMGICQYTVPRTSILPFTNTQVRIAEGMSELFGDQRSVDGFGLPVDLLLTTKESQSAHGIEDLVLKLAGKAR
jgi:hypothetical protein